MCAPVNRDEKRGFRLIPREDSSSRDLIQVRVAVQGPSGFRDQTGFPSKEYILSYTVI